MFNNWKIWPFIQLVNFKVLVAGKELTIVCAAQLSTIGCEYRGVGMELYAVLRWRMLMVGYLSAVNAPPKTEQEAKEKLTILVE